MVAIIGLKGQIKSMTNFEDRAEQEGWIRRTRKQHNLHGTPRVGQVFWVVFPADAYAPEFEGEHPGVVVRAAQSMSDTCIVVPLTHRPAVTNIHAHKLVKNPNPDDSDDGWAICNHLYTVSLGRLRRFQRRGHFQDIYLSTPDQQAIFTCVQRALHVVFAAEAPVMPPPAQPKARGPKTLSLDRR
jgi:uncharacterized protein YifN (PemK superfamily)